MSSKEHVLDHRHHTVLFVHLTLYLGHRLSNKLTARDFTFYDVKAFRVKIEVGVVFIFFKPQLCPTLLILKFFIGQCSDIGMITRWWAQYCLHSLPFLETRHGGILHYFIFSLEFPAFPGTQCPLL